VVRASDRATIKLQSGVTWESLVPRDVSDTEIVIASYPPGVEATQGLIQHGGRDFYHVLEGELVVKLVFEEHRLWPGDSITFDGALPHQLSNPTGSMTRVVAVVYGDPVSASVARRFGGPIEAEHRNTHDGEGP
jgi:mannose-6-phosphate isomerase-like protein (cupin superfamily)